jgi:hypothetical protein
MGTRFSLLKLLGNHVDEHPDAPVRACNRRKF